MSDDNLNALRCPIASQMSMNALILERGRGGGEKAYLEKERAPGAQGRSGAGTFSHGMPYIISLVSFARVAIDVLTACATVRPQFPPSFVSGQENSHTNSRLSTLVNSHATLVLV